MNDVALGLLQLDYAHPYLVSFGLLLLFAAISVTAIKPGFALGRAGYFLVLGLFLFLIGVRTIIDRLALEALKTDAVLTWVLGSFACLAAMGGVLGLASAARSIDAYGHRNNWYMGFIPLIGLILLFKGPKEPKRLSFPRLTGNSLLVICGFLLLGMGRVLSEFATGGLGGDGFGQSGSQMQSEVAQDGHKEFSLSTYLNNQVGKMRQNWLLDDSESFLGVDILGNTVRFTFERADGLSHNDSPLWMNQKIFDVCTSLEMGINMEMGAVIEKRYLSQEGRLLDDLRVEKPDCEGLSAQLALYMKGWVDEARSGIRIDSDTISTSAEYGDTFFKIYFKYTGGKKNLSEDYVKKNLCDQKLFRDILLFDKRVWGVYRTDDGADLAGASVDNVTCQSLRKGNFLTETQDVSHSGQNSSVSSVNVAYSEKHRRAVESFFKDKLVEIPSPRIVEKSEVPISAEVAGDTVIYTFERTNGLTFNGSPSWQIMESFEVCRDSKLASYMELGATVERKYVTHQGEFLDDIKVDASVCPTLPAEISPMLQGFAGFAKTGIRIDDETVSTYGEYLENLFTVDFKYTGDLGNVSENYIQRKICAHPIFEEITVFDVSVHGVYKSDKGEALGEATVNYAMCQSFEKG